VQRVVAETMAVNTASRRVMEKTGLTLERAFYRDWPDPIEGAEHGEVEYALRKADWEQRQAEGGEQREGRVAVRQKSGLPEAPAG
jgi:RimJ/RimL family protein N-acetyltransferase